MNHKAYKPASDVLLGMKGNTFLEAGYVYAPYVPIQATPLFGNPTLLLKKLRKAGINVKNSWDMVVGFSKKAVKHVDKP